MAGINKTPHISPAEGGMIGVANCASFGKNKHSSVTSTNSTYPLGSGTRLVKTTVVAGGGGAGYDIGGGGGAGGVVTQDNVPTTSTANITVGAGGASSGNTVTKGTNGQN